MKPLLLLLLLLLPFAKVSAQKDAIDKSTDVLAVLPTATGVVAAVIEHDRKGAIQLGLSTASTLAINYGLEALIKKDRPDGSGHHSFPSTHTAVAFDGSTYLMRRYGWKWGVPAYIASTYVAWGRVYADKHDVWDVLGGAAIGTGCAFLFTRPFMKEKQITLAPASFGHEGCGVYLSMVF